MTLTPLFGSLFISLGRRAHLHIIARKLHSAGRGPSATTTSPSAASPSATALSTLDATALLQSGDVHTPLISSAAQDGTLDTEAVPAVRPPLVSTDTISNDLAASLSAFANPATPIAADVLLPSIPPSNPDTTTGSMLDAQAIQAQVEALIQSTSSAVADKAVASQPPSIPSLPPASILSAPLSQPLPAVHGVLETAPQTYTRPSLQQSTTASAADTPDAAALRATSASRPNTATGAGFENTFAQYQFPQSADRALNMSGRNAEAEGAHVDGTQSPPTGANNGKQRVNTAVSKMTREEEEQAADALIADIDAPAAAAGTSQRVKAEAFSGADLAAAAKAIGLEADADLLGGMDQDQRALAAAIRRLGDEHGEAAQKAIQQAAAAAAAAAAARASQELARAAAREQRSDAKMSHRAPDLARSSTPASAASSSSRARSGPSKRFPCPKCDKAFARAYNLNTHLSTHDPDPNRSKPFACPYPSCKSEGGRSFSRKHDLQRHVASIHENEAEPGIHGDPEEVVGGDTGGLVSLGLGTPGKKFRCNNCGRSFVRRDARNRHQCDGSGSPSDRLSESPSSSTFASSASPRPSASQSMVGGSAVTLPPIRPMVSALHAAAAAGTPLARSSPSPAAGRPADSLSKEVQAVAKQLQARVEAQSPGPQGHASSQRNAPPLASGERRNFPLSAISLYASTGTPHSSSSSSSSSGKVQIAK